MKSFAYASAALIVAVITSGEAKEPAPPPTRATPLGDPAMWVNSDDYPIAAMADEVEGMTGFILDVGPDGHVTGCTIAISSGSDILDETTCKVMSARARFSPAKDRKGRPVPDHISRRITWRLPNAEDMRLSDYPMRFKAELIIDEAGLVEDCHILERTGGPAPALAIDEKAVCAGMKKQRATQIVDKSGNAIRAKMTTTYETVITPE